MDVPYQNSCVRFLNLLLMEADSLKVTLAIVIIWCTELQMKGG